MAMTTLNNIIPSIHELEVLNHTTNDFNTSFVIMINDSTNDKSVLVKGSLASLRRKLSLFGGFL